MPIKKNHSMKIPKVSEARAREIEAEAEAQSRGVAGSTKLPVASSTGRLVYQRKGRLLADGSRTPAVAKHKLTVYIPEEMGKRLAIVAVTLGRDRSTLVERALTDWLEANA